MKSRLPDQFDGLDQQDRRRVFSGEIGLMDLRAEKAFDAAAQQVWKWCEELGKPALWTVEDTVGYGIYMNRGSADALVAAERASRDGTRYTIRVGNIVLVADDSPEFPQLLFRVGK